MKYILILSMVYLGGCAQVTDKIEKASMVVNKIDGSRIKLLKKSHDLLYEKWRELDMKNLEDRMILDSMRRDW